MRVSAVGLCGSDRHWFARGRDRRRGLAQPLVLGHEFAGVVESGPRAGRARRCRSGDAVRRVRVCLPGSAHLCPAVRFAGHGSTDGALRTLARLARAPRSSAARRGHRRRGGAARAARGRAARARPRPCRTRDDGRRVRLRAARPAARAGCCDPPARRRWSPPTGSRTALAAAEELGATHAVGAGRGCPREGLDVAFEVGGRRRGGRRRDRLAPARRTPRPRRHPRRRPDALHRVGRPPQGPDAALCRGGWGGATCRARSGSSRRGASSWRRSSAGGTPSTNGRRRSRASCERRGLKVVDRAVTASRPTPRDRLRHRVRPRRARRLCRRLARCATCVYPYANGVIDERLPAPTSTLEPDWALQDPADYVRTLQHAVPALLAETGVDRRRWSGSGIDFTVVHDAPDDWPTGRRSASSTIFAAEPHAWVKLWKHHAAQPEADGSTPSRASEASRGCRRYGGRISSEWFFAKALQILDEAPEVYARAGPPDRGRRLGRLAAHRRRDAQHLHRRLQGDVVEARRLPVARLLRGARPAVRARRGREDVAADRRHRQARRRPRRARRRVDGAAARDAGRRRERRRARVCARRRPHAPGSSS